MAFPVVIDSTAPAQTDSPGFGDDEIRALKQAILDLLGLTAGNVYSGPLVNAGTLLDGKVAAGLTIKGASPIFGRALGTEANAKDIAWQEDGGLLRLMVNSGTEAVPVWNPLITINLTLGELRINVGAISWFSGTAFAGTLAHANTADRVYTFQDRDGVIADQSDFAPNILRNQIFS